MRKSLILGIFLSLSCATMITGFDENKQSYYMWRVNRSYGNIFRNTRLSGLDYLVYSDDGDGLKEKVRRENIDITVKGWEGISLLSWTVGARLLNVSEALLELGADPDYLNNLDISILGVAVLSRYAEMVDVLLPYMENMYYSTNQKGQREETYINEVVIYESKEILEVFLENGFDPDWGDEKGNPLMDSVRGRTTHELAIILLNAGASPITSEEEREWFVWNFKEFPFGKESNPRLINYSSNEYGEIYQRMIEFGVAEPNEAHNEWLVSQGREPNS
jgi:ankyrin repeat protein